MVFLVEFKSFRFLISYSKTPPSLLMTFIHLYGHAELAEGCLLFILNVLMPALYFISGCGSIYIFGTFSDFFFLYRNVSEKSTLVNFSLTSK